MSIEVATIFEPNGQPYLTIIDDEKVVKIQMCQYIKNKVGNFYFVIDKRCLSQLIDALKIIER